MRNPSFPRVDNVISAPILSSLALLRSFSLPTCCAPMWGGEACHDVLNPYTQVLVPRAARLFDEQVDVRDEGTREEIRHLVDAGAHGGRRGQPEQPASAPPPIGPNHRQPHAGRGHISRAP